MTDEKPRRKNTKSEPPISVPKVDLQSLVRKFGYMSKKSANGGGYRLRFFELDAISEYLTYYTDDPYVPGQNKAMYRGTIGLCDAKIEPINKGSKAKLVIKTRNGKKFKLLCKDVEDRDSWVEALQAARDAAIDPNKLIVEWKRNKYCEKCLVYSDEDVISDGNTSDDNAMDNQNVDLFSLPVRDTNGVTVRLGDVVGSRLTAVVLLRQYGCPSCKKTIHLWQRKLDAFEELGIQLVAIGTGNSVAGVIFKKETGFPGQIYSDTDRKIYRYVGARRGFKYAFSLQSLAGVSTAISEGFSAGSVQGDALQLGGAFLCTKEDGLIWTHIDRFVGHIVSFDDMLKAAADYIRLHPWSTWATVPSFSWNDITPPTKNKAMSCFAPQSLGYHVERGTSRVDLTSAHVFVVDNMLTYQKLFAPNEHQIWVSPTKPEQSDDEHKMAIVAGMSDGSRGDKKILMFHTSGEIRRIVPAFRFHSDTEMLKHLSMSTVGYNLQLRPIEELSVLKEALIKYESQGSFKQFKIGLLYVRPGQTEELQIYQNTAADASPDYEEFLQFIGTKIALKGWPQYKGGLDTKKDLTGTHSIFANLEDISIMFHVGTMIPLDKDQGALERKRHIGNDVVVLLFKEGNHQIDPTLFRSQFNHVFVVVSKEKTDKHSDGKTFYRVEVMTKPQVPPFAPFLPDPPIFEKGPEFRNFLLTKLINAEKTTSRYVPIFKDKMQRVRAEFIRQIIKTACASAETLSKRAKMRRAKSDIKVVNRATLKQNAVPTKLPVQKPLKIVSIAPAERASNDKPEAKEKPNTGSTDFSALEEEVLELTKKRGSVRQSRRLTQRSMSSEPTTSKMLDKIEPIYENPTHENTILEEDDEMEALSESAKSAQGSQLSTSTSSQLNASAGSQLNTSTSSTSSETDNSSTASPSHDANSLNPPLDQPTEAAPHSPHSETPTQLSPTTNTAVPEQEDTTNTSTASPARPPAAPLAKKNPNFAKLQLQWQTMADSAANSTPNLRGPRTFGPAPGAKKIGIIFRTEAITKPILTHTDLMTDTRRIIIINEADTTEKEIVLLGANDTLATFKAVIEKELGKPVLQLSFEGVPIQDKHLRLLRDRDVVVATFCN